MRSKRWNWKKETNAQAVFLIIYFGVIFVWMILQPLGDSPDEDMRYLICKYIFTHWRLPHGADPEILDHTWGFSYAFQPILPYMIMAVFMKVSIYFIPEAYIAVLSARLVNVICGTIMAYFVCRIGNKIFVRKAPKWMFILLCTMLPEAMFMHTYINTDSMALMSTAIMFYAWILGMESDWNKKSIIVLSTGISLCALSYYNAYGFILSSIFLFSFCYFQRKSGKILIDWKRLMKKGLAVSALVLIMIGWWFARSYILYDGDFLGLSTRNAYAEVYARQDLKPSIHETYFMDGYSIFYMLMHSNFVVLTVRSFIAMFGNMSIGVYNWIYHVYYLVIGIGLMGFLYPLKKREYLVQFEQIKLRLIHICLFISLVIPNLLNLWAAYSYDYQPQGRYSLPMLLPLMYFVVVGFHKGVSLILRQERAVRIAECVVCGFVIVAAVLSLTDFIIPAYYNTFMDWYKNTFLVLLQETN